MGIYLLAGIIFVLFVVFMIDFIRDSRHRGEDGRTYYRFPRYREEFGEDDFYTYDDYRYRDDDYGEDLADDEMLADDDYHLNFKDEFGEDIIYDIPLDDLNFEEESEE